MKIFIDINHPAQVHYFRGFISKMESLGHAFIVTNRDDKLINYLLDFYQIEHHIRNKRPGRSSALKSLQYLVTAIVAVRKRLKGEYIDVFVGFGSSIAAINSFLYGKPCILLDDTEHNKLNHIIYRPFVSALLTPFYFQKQVVKDQIYFKAYIENLYLNFSEKKGSILRKPCVLCRFTSFDASHDRNVDVDALEAQRFKIVELLSQTHRVVVCPEDVRLNEKYRDFLIDFKPEEIHALISGAILFISDGATMACEAGILGVPYVYTNPLKVGNIDEQCKTMNYAFQMGYGKLYQKLKEDSSYFFQETERVPQNLDDFVDPTDFLVWFVEHFPESKKAYQAELITKGVFEQISAK